MKKLVLMSAFAVSLLSLGGCALQQNAQDEALLQKISLLEQQVAGLEEEKAFLEAKDMEQETETIEDAVEKDADSEHPDYDLLEELDSLREENKNIKAENERLEALALKYKTALVDERNSQNSDSTEPQGQIVTDTPPTPQKTYLYFYLVNEDPTLANDDPNKLVPITYEDSTYGSIEESIESALKKLFSIKTHGYGESGYSNFLYKSNLTVDSVSNDGSKTIVKINGDVIGISSMADYLLKQQIIKTIEKYSTNYELRLNGSTKNWECALDASGLCN